jgi:hypothetical protein
MGTSIVMIVIPIRRYSVMKTELLRLAVLVIGVFVLIVILTLI